MFISIWWFMILCFVLTLKKQASSLRLEAAGSPKYCWPPVGLHGVITQKPMKTSYTYMYTYIHACAHVQFFKVSTLVLNWNVVLKQVLYLLLLEMGVRGTVPSQPSELQYVMERDDAVPGTSQDTSPGRQDPANRSSGRQSFCHDFKIGNIPSRLRCVFLICSRHPPCANVSDLMSFFSVICHLNASFFVVIRMLTLLGDFWGIFPLFVFMKFVIWCPLRIFSRKKCVCFECALWIADSQFWSWLYVSHLLQRTFYNPLVSNVPITQSNAQNA